MAKEEFVYMEPFSLLSTIFPNLILYLSLTLNCTNVAPTDGCMDQQAIDRWIIS